MRDPGFRSDAAGSFQSLIGLWQILVRQGTLPESQADAAFGGIVQSFGQVHNERELFAASRGGVKLLIGATNTPHEHMVDLLAGASRTEDVETRDAVKQEIFRILEAQRIVSLDTLFQLADKLESSEKLNMAQFNKLASRLSEIQIPRPPLSANEKNAMGFGYWTERHLEFERRLNLRLAVEKAAGDPAKLKDITGQLAPLLRDTLLAFNYAHYAPPGAQVLLHQSGVRAQPRFHRRRRPVTHLACHRICRHRMAVEWRRPAGGFAVYPALRAGGGRAELPGARPNPGADLGRPGAADDSQRQDSALVDGFAGSGSLGRTALALRPRTAGGIRL